MANASRMQVTSTDQQEADAERAVLSSFLRRTLPELPLYDRPPTWRLRVWQWCCGGKHGSALASIAATGSLLKAVLDSPDLNSSCVALMDVALMLGTVFYQVTFTNRRAATRRMLEDLGALAEEMEPDATDEELADLRATVRSMSRTRRVTSIPVVVIPSLMLLGPFLTGELTMSFYPKPTGVLWYLVCITQGIGTVTCPLCVNAIMFTLLMVSSSAAALCRCISGRMQAGGGPRAVLRMARQHRLIMEIADHMADTYYLTLFILITGLLTTSLLATYNVATGVFDAYTALLVPGALLFYYNIAVISDNLATSTVDVCDGVWSSPWTEEGVAMRRVLLNMMTRAQKEGSVRVPLLGAVTLPVFKDSMRQWYSFLQMIRSVNGN